MFPAAIIIALTEFKPGPIIHDDHESANRVAVSCDVQIVGTGLADPPLSWTLSSINIGTFSPDH